MLSRRVSTCLDRITRVVFSSGLGRRAIVKVYKLTTRLINAVETWERCVPRATLLIRSLHLLRYYLLSLLLLSTYGGNKSNNFSRDFTRGAARYDAFVKSILAILLESTCTLPSIIFFFFSALPTVRFITVRRNVYSPRRELRRRNDINTWHPSRKFCLNIRIYNTTLLSKNNFEGTLLSSIT